MSIKEKVRVEVTVEYNIPGLETMLGAQTQSILEGFAKRTGLYVDRLNWRSLTWKAHFYGDNEKQGKEFVRRIKRSQRLKPYLTEVTFTCIYY